MCEQPGRPTDARQSPRSALCSASVLAVTASPSRQLPPASPSSSRLLRVVVLGCVGVQDSCRAKHILFLQRWDTLNTQPLCLGIRIFPFLYLLFLTSSPEYGILTGEEHREWPICLTEQMLMLERLP